MKKVLLVDDDPFILDIYSTQLKAGGYSVDMASNISDALEKVTNNCPDVLMLDLNLDVQKPGPKGGLDILKQIRLNPRTRNVKVIVVSNYNTKDYPELSNLNSLGVVKSFIKIETSPQEVMKTVEEILK